MGGIADGLFGGGQDAPAPPDYTPIMQASDHAADLGYQAASNDLAFRQQVYNQNIGRQNQLYDLAAQTAQQQLGIASQNQQQAQDQWNYWKQTFQPTEQQMNLDAYQSQYLTPDEIQTLQSDPSQANALAKTAADRKANQDVAGLQSLQDQQVNYLQGQQQLGQEGLQAQIASSFDQQGRNLARMGAGNPNRIAALATQIGGQQALTRVAGLNQLNQNYGAMINQVQQQYGNQMQQIQANRYAQGDSLRAGVAAFGRNMPNTAGQAYGLATQAGNSAVANQNTGFLSGLPYAQFQSGAYGTQLGAAGLGAQTALGQGSILNQGYGTQVNAYNASQQMAGQGLAGLGQLAGSVLGSSSAPWWLASSSDRRLKNDVVRVGTHPLGIGLYEYTIAGRREVGVMADEVEKVRPEAVCVGPDGYKRVFYEKLG